MEKQNAPSARDGAAGKRRPWMPVLLLLLVLALITSGISGYVLGRNAGTPPLGQIIDTVILGPETPEAQTVLHLAGRVVYADGTPAAGRTLELRSDPVTTISGSNGDFLFEDVPQGEHTVSILNADGTKAAERKIEIVRDAAAQNATLKQQDNGAYLLEIAVDIRVLEIELELDAQTMTIRPDFSYATREGVVTTTEGSASIQDGVIVTPQGNVFLPDGSVVFPGGDQTDVTRILLPDDSVTIDRPLSADGIEVSPDGVVTLPDGTVIEPGGQIRQSDGKDETPGETGVIVGDGTVTPIGGRPSAMPTPAPSPEDPAGAGSPPETAEPSESARPDPPGTPTPKPAESPEPSPPLTGSGGSSSGSDTPSVPEVPDDGVLGAYVQNADGSYVEWTQNHTIDLFYNRTSGDRDKIAPGSSGYYLFRLENSRRSELRIQVELAENGVHLPLTFTLTPLDAQGNPITEKAASGSLNGNSLTLNAAMAAGDTVTYRLDWVWPFEGNDEKDTDAGGGTNLTYTLLMKIHAEEGA